MRARDFLKEESGIRWKPFDDKGRAWAVSPDSWESGAAQKINNFLFDKWLALKQTLGMEVTPEELEDWQHRHYKAIPQVIIDDNGDPQWNPEWTGDDGETAQEAALRHWTAQEKKRKEHLDSLVQSDDNDEQNYVTPTPRVGNRPSRSSDRTVDRSKGRTSRFSTNGKKE